MLQKFVEFVMKNPSVQQVYMNRATRYQILKDGYLPENKNLSVSSVLVGIDETVPTGEWRT
jgi:hypothetical protein